MEKSERSKDMDKLYLQICKMLTKYSNKPLPTKEKFMENVNTFNQLVEGHQLLLTAIGKL